MRFREFIKKYLFIITFLIYVLVDKGVCYLLSMLNIDLGWSSIFSFNFLMDTVLSIVELFIIAVILLMCVETDDHSKITNYVGYICFILIIMMMLSGITAHYRM